MEESARNIRGFGSISLIGGLWADVLLLELPLAFQFRIVKTAGIAESAGTVRASSPLWCVDPVAAVASARGGGSLSSRQHERSTGNQVEQKGE